ncbi:hypothetical protein DWW91_11340 [Parabacteroides sp. AF17-3]|uniref:hypothetical protein n=1 Tax=Parabacteroides sp. AF17-3 TaxID=2293113 RepID=UPI000EFFB7DF|nr:hypothetical protein [Parabacteroides sp. AF17-3]RKU69580.1 hypothetical protein DWW91_11340 [Parabacteroides sp. AF17-3]
MSKKFPPQARCYNCGKLIPDKDRTWEHIPMDALYKGFTEEDKRTRIQVCACRSCNQQYSYIEQRLRNLIAVIGLLKKENNLSEIIGASMRSLKTDLEYKEQWTKLDDENYYFSINTKDYDDIHIKNLKGIIYNDLGFSLPDDEYKFVVMSDCGKECNGDDFDTMIIKSSREFLRDRPNWKESGNLNIFKYRLGVNWSFNYELPIRVQDIDIIICPMIYHNLVYAIVKAYKNEVYEKLSKSSFY